jgi:hypothetical protein
VKILTPLFLLGSFTLAYFVFIRYPPVETTATMVLFVLGFFVLAIFFRQGRMEKVTARYILAALLPWVIAGFFFANAALDYSEETVHPTVVVQTYYGTRWQRKELIVRSWRSGRTTESVYVSSFQPFFYEGQHVAIGVKSGALGVSWISSISR